MSDQRDPMVSAAWLKARLGAPFLVVIDATWFLPGDQRDARAQHAAARIPGAIFFDIDAIADTTSTLPHMLPTPEAFAQIMSDLGVRDEDCIIVYDSQGLFSAARVWWTFRVMGVNEVFVLDGGLPAWRAAGGAIESGPREPRPKAVFKPHRRGDLVWSLHDVRCAVDQGDALILDARPPSRFSGAAPEPRAGLRAGHMPGARNLPASDLIDENGALLGRERLERVFTDAGWSAQSQVACTCGSGVTAAIIALALARLGFWDAPVYDGAWAEWAARVDTPIVAGDE